jgi:hypothetical protein
VHTPTLTARIDSAFTKTVSLVLAVGLPLTLAFFAIQAL